MKDTTAIAVAYYTSLGKKNLEEVGKYLHPDIQFTDDYIILEKNERNAFQQVLHVHFHLLPIHSEAWSDIFDIVPDRLNREDLGQQISLFREYFKTEG